MNELQQRAQAQGLMAGAAEAPGRTQEAHLVHLERKLSNVHDMVCHLEDELNGLVDRALGEPPGVEDAPRGPGNELRAVEIPTPSGAVGVLFDRADGLRRSCERAIRALNRIKTII